MAPTDLPLNARSHDVIVIGGSSGCFGTIRLILQSLPADFPAAILIAAHVAPSVSLRSILDGRAKMPVKVAASGDRLQSGRVYLAASDAHLLVHDHHVLVRRGPRENLSRPAIDVLFRSAACALGPRVIGVLLSGYLNDGSAGLDAIKVCGGLAVVQDPLDAEVPSMPRRAMETVRIDHCVPGQDIADLLARLIQQPVGATVAVPSALKLEVAIAAQEAAGMSINDSLGERSAFTCPDCGGVLWQIRDTQVLRFRCHVGHAVTAEMLLDEQRGAVNHILSRLLRTHEERAALARKLAAQAAGRAQGETAARHLEVRADDYAGDASIVRGLMAKFHQDDGI